MSEQFKSWAVVEVMGHVTYAGYVTAETVAGAAMLRIDVPEVGARPAFTKYISPGAIYGITPCTEETARLKAEGLHADPFNCWDVGQAITNKLREQGKLIEHKKPQYDDCDFGEEDDHA